MDNTNEKLERYYGMIYRFAFIQVKNRQEAEDIAQETLYRFLRSDVTFEQAEQERAWLFKVASNLCKNLWRSVWHSRVSGYDEERLSCSGLEEDILKKEDAKELLNVVQSLPVKYKKAIHLFYYEEMPVKQISCILGVKESTVQTHLARGRELIKKKLERKPQQNRNRRLKP